MAGMKDTAAQGTPIGMEDFLHINVAAQAAGTSLEDLMTVGQIETKLMTGRSRPGENSAKGVFQILPSTAAEAGIDPENISDAALWTANQLNLNRDIFEAEGLPSDLTAQFLGHNMGTEGARQILTSMKGTDKPLSETRLEAMRNNLGDEGAALLDMLKTDKEKATYFVKATGRKILKAQEELGYTKGGKK